MDYELQEMSGERAKAVLQDLLTDLSTIELSDLTVLEANFIRRVAKNPPIELTSPGWIP